MKRLLLIVLCIAAAIILVDSAQAGYQDTRLNTISSQVAGHPVIVGCTSSPREWEQWQVVAGITTFEADGFTFVGVDTTIYLAPRICDTLLALLDSRHDAVGTYWAGLAIRVFLHESVHQQGITDEAITECTAMSLIQQYAPAFGFAPTVQTTVYTRVPRTKTYRRTIKTVPNPALAGVLASAQLWHSTMPANYLAVC